jgi:general stress protein CsbA
MIQNSGNNYYISINMRNKLIMASYECETMINEFILYIDPKKPEKK